MAPPERFELPTLRSEDECSGPLSYGGFLIHLIVIKNYKSLLIF